MAVEQHPLFPKYLRALERLIEAKERLRQAQRTGAASIAAAERDLARARLEYFQIADEV